MSDPNYYARQKRILDQISDERDRQDLKWGPGQSHPDGTSGMEFSSIRDLMILACEMAEPVTWTDILREEVYEALAEDGGPDLRKELIQSAAVIVGWIEDLDRKAGE